MTNTAFFLDLETRVWQALVDGDPAADAALLAGDFLGVYSTGFSGRDGHVEQLADGPTVATFALSLARTVALGEGRVLLAYRADYRRTGATGAEAMYVSSIWEKRGDRWLNTFSQDSNAADPAPV
ncbi:DUF4440 domain-containing protein [Psychromarinibacter sp. S121]|uniref:DUF4440 domain-containing protein n=1 Tax=Psychromarinibacter sp. S121 TaxID=3415127 RepID=UPI003C7AB20B